MFKQLAIVALLSAPLQAQAAYWSVFNIESESAVDSAFVTYNTLEDMLTDTNRTGLHTPGNAFSPNIVGSGNDGRVYWNVFNIEGESSIDSAFVTYNTRMDMLTDTNRTGLHTPGNAFSPNIVGSGSDGKVYWNVFNIEGESAIDAAFVTYGTLGDMLTDTNRTGLHTPGNAFSPNIVGSGSDGKVYWNIFNIEGESAIDVAFVTYGALLDMLTDTNRTGVYSPGNLFSRNIVGGDADVIVDMPSNVPIPAAAALFPAGLGVLGLLVCRRQRQRAISPRLKA